MSEVTQTQTLEQALNKTDFGHLIFENRKMIFSLILAIFIGVTGYVLWNQSQKSQGKVISAQVFEFQSKTWSQAKEDKLSSQDLVKAFEGLDKNVQTAPIMVPLALEMGKFLFDKGAFTEAEAILSKIQATHPVAAFFVGSQRAVILEKLNQIPQAISVLEKLASDKDALMAAKVNLELGRLNMINGDKAKAQTHFDYVINTFPNDEQAKLAKLYLGKLSQ